MILPDGLHVQDLVSKVRAKVVELSSDFWQTHYNALREWTEAHGHARPVTGGSLQSTVYKGFKIGDWVSRQRIQYQKGHMSHVRATLFEELPGWSWDPRQDRWDQWLLELTAYYAGEIVRPPHLNRWISRVRDRYAAGTLGQDRVTQLEAIEARIAARTLTQEQKSVRINGRSIDFADEDELKVARAHYKYLVELEKNPSGRLSHAARFTRP